MSATTELEKLTAATKMLAEIASASDAWNVARTAEAARHYAQLRNLGHESINFATSIRAKALLILADLVDAGQESGTISSAGRPVKTSGGEENLPRSLVELGIGDTANQAAKAVHEARRLREALRGQDIDQLVKEANEHGEDLGIRGLRRMASEKRVPEPVKEPVTIPLGTYRTICADPPWNMSKMRLDAFPDDGLSLAYPTLPSFCSNGFCMKPECNSIQCVMGRVLDKCAAENCSLYLWTTQKFLPDALALTKNWNFRYHALLVWLKNSGMTPFSFRFNCEVVVFAYKGHLEMLKMGQNLSFEQEGSCEAFDAPATGHSIKPDIFYQRVIEASPGPRLELFARKPREGFDVWGNAV